MNDTFEHFLDVQIIECDDFVSVLPSLVLTGNILLITSKGFTTRGLVEKVVDKCGVSRVSVFDNVTPNPEKSFLQTNITQFTQNKIEHVIALGGGSAIDAAKVFCALLSHPDTLLDDLLLSDEVENEVNLIAIPTTSGTGSEVTPFATVWQSDIAKKHSLYGIRPNVALLDPSLTLSLPPEDTLYPALDALSHALESLWNNNRTDASQTYALAAIQLISDNLNLILDNPRHLDARKNLQIAATLAGLAISITKTAIAHAISYPLTLQYEIPHGLACSFSLSAILNIVGNEKLNLPVSLADRVVRLLDSLNLEKEISRYVELGTLRNNFVNELEPSRAGNFIGEVNAQLVKKILFLATDNKR